jgi:hypothetical protein
MSWQQLHDIRQQAREDRRLAQTTPPIACPIDGEVLDIRPDGVRNCRAGNYTWTG